MNSKIQGKSWERGTEKKNTSTTPAAKSWGMRRYSNGRREGDSSSGRAVPTASKKREKPSLPAGKPAPPAQNRDISVLPTSLILASVGDVAWPAPSDTLRPLRTANDANRKFCRDYGDWSILSKRYQTSFHRGPPEATGLQRHVTVPVGTQSASLSQARHAT